MARLSTALTLTVCCENRIRRLARPHPGPLPQERETSRTRFDIFIAARAGGRNGDSPGTGKTPGYAAKPFANKRGVRAGDVAAAQAGGTVNAIVESPIEAVQHCLNVQAICLVWRIV